MQRELGATPSVSTRTADFTPCELPLAEWPEVPRPPPRPRSHAPERIREAVRRWFEGEL
jgi:hypothetical protein